MNTISKTAIEQFAIAHGVVFSERDNTEKRVQSYTCKLTKEVRLTLRVMNTSIEEAKAALTEYLGDIPHHLKEVQGCYAFNNVSFVGAVFD